MIRCAECAARMSSAPAASNCRAAIRPTASAPDRSPSAAARATRLPSGAMTTLVSAILSPAHRRVRTDRHLAAAAQCVDHCALGAERVERVRCRRSAPPPRPWPRPPGESPRRRCPARARARTRPAVRTPKCVRPARAGASRPRRARWRPRRPDRACAAGCRGCRGTARTRACGSSTVSCATRRTLLVPIRGDGPSRAHRGLERQLLGRQPAAPAHRAGPRAAAPHAPPGRRAAGPACPCCCAPPGRWSRPAARPRFP